jgi:hypothetical protein
MIGLLMACMLLVHVGVMVMDGHDGRSVGDRVASRMRGRRCLGRGVLTYGEACPRPVRHGLSASDAE